MGCIDLLRSDIRFLGVGGSNSKKSKTTSLQVAYDTLIDGGYFLEVLKNESRFIENIFLTHSHLDHISDIPYLFDLYFDKLKNPVKIYALQETIDDLKKHIFNSKIWPDFSQIKLPNTDKYALEYRVIEYEKTYKFSTFSLTPVKANHTVPACGFVIEKPNYKTLFMPDTKASDDIQNYIKDYEIDSLVVDCSYPQKMSKLADESGHFCTKSLADEVNKYPDIDVHVVHIKSNYYDEVVSELKSFSVLKGNGRVISDGEFLQNADFKEYENHKIDFIKLIAKEKDLDTILKTILIEAMKITRSDGGTIYLKEGRNLRFKTVINQKLNIFSTNINWPIVPLYVNDKENTSNVSALCALKNQVINIDDVYKTDDFNFEGTKVFDKNNNYRSKSMLVVPLTDYDNNVIGVLQLINKNNFLDIENYTKEDEKEILSYSIFAATAISKNKLIEDLENLFLSFVQSISFAINKKSIYGYRHIIHVKKLMKYMLFAINQDKTLFKDKYYTTDEQKELAIAALVHDLGKITIPDYILDKSMRLSGLHDKIFEIKERFSNAINSLKIDMLELEVAYLNGKVDVDIENVKKAYLDEMEKIREYFEFIKTINNPAKSLTDEDIQKLNMISKISFHIEEETYPLLTEDEVENLSVRYGNLTEDEKELVNSHAQRGYEMLSKLKLPKKYENIPQIAGFHHEKLNGKGYPFGLKDDELSQEVRMLTICDIFEALTSSDRPYKKAKSKDEAFAIMDKMADNHEIDKELFEFFKQSGIFDKFLDEIKLSVETQDLALA